MLRLPSPSWLLFVAVFVACSGKDADSGGADPWQMPDVDLGPARVTGTTADFSGGEGVYFALSHVLPGMQFDEPSVDLPLHLFEGLALQADVADEGSCPYSQVEDGATVWRSDCRSSNGYEWTGGMRLEAWEQGGVELRRWDFDLAVVGGEDRHSFDSLRLEGAVVYGRGGDEDTLVTGIQGNIISGLSGHWSRAGDTDPREASWREVGWSGREELLDSGSRRMAGTASVAGVGSFSVDSAALSVDPACSLGPAGEVRIGGQQDIDATLYGADDCRQCAGVVVDGQPAAESCGD